MPVPLQIAGWCDGVDDAAIATEDLLEVPAFADDVAAACSPAAAAIALPVVPVPAQIAINAESVDDAASTREDRLDIPAIAHLVAAAGPPAESSVVAAVVAILNKEIPR